MKIEDSLITVKVFIYTFLHDKVTDQVPQNFTQLDKSLNFTGRRIKNSIITLNQ